MKEYMFYVRFLRTESFRNCRVSVLDIVLYYLSDSIFEKIYLPEFVVQISLHLTPWPIHTAINKPKLNCPRPQLTRTCIWGDQETR